MREAGPAADWQLPRQVLLQQWAAGYAPARHLLRAVFAWRHQGGAKEIAELLLPKTKSGGKVWKDGRRLLRVKVLSDTLRGELHAA